MEIGFVKYSMCMHTYHYRCSVVHSIYSCTCVEAFQWTQNVKSCVLNRWSQLNFSISCLFLFPGSLLLVGCYLEGQIKANWCPRQRLTMVPLANYKKRQLKSKTKLKSNAAVKVMGMIARGKTLWCPRSLGVLSTCLFYCKPHIWDTILPCKNLYAAYDLPPTLSCFHFSHDT